MTDGSYQAGASGTRVASTRPRLCRVKCQAKGQWPTAKGDPDAVTLSGAQILQGILMAKIENFRELVAWQKGMELAEKVYRVTRFFPREDLFTLGTQLRRAANSIPANVSEGFSRRSQGVYRSHVAIALGSNAEVQTHLELCRRLS